VSDKLLASNRKVLVVGCGYLGMRIARLCISRNTMVYALTRKQDKVSSFTEHGIHPVVQDWYESEGWPLLPEFDAAFVCVSHAAVTGIDPVETHVKGLENLLRSLAATPSRIVYLSTTGVYAHCDDGRWLDERSAVEPNRPGSVAAWAAEQWLSVNLPADRLTILRAAGIYGPDRIPRVDSLRKNEPLNSDPDSYLNLIHVDDLASIAVQAAQQQNAFGLFAVSDGQPVLRRDYYQFIANFLGTSAPRFQPSESENGSTVRRRGEGSKRIQNRRLRDVLKHDFLFPDYQAGLRPLLLNA
jgi:nucleoside-diphosphate-sugar epimerase